MRHKLLCRAFGFKPTFNRALDGVVNHADARQVQIAEGVPLFLCISGVAVKADLVYRVFIEGYDFRFEEGTCFTGSVAVVVVGRVVVVVGRVVVVVGRVVVVVGRVVVVVGRVGAVVGLVAAVGAVGCVMGAVGPVTGCG